MFTLLGLTTGNYGAKGVVSCYQIGLILPSVAETHKKIYPSRCYLQFSISRHARGKVLSLENHHSLFKDILFASICWTWAHGTPSSLDYQLEEPSFRFSKKSYANNYEANGLNFWVFLLSNNGFQTMPNQNRVVIYKSVSFDLGLFSPTSIVPS